MVVVKDIIMSRNLFHILGYGGAYKTMLDHKLFFTFNFFNNFDIGNKIMKNGAFFIKTFFPHVENSFPKVALI